MHRYTGVFIILTFDGGFLFLLLFTVGPLAGGRGRPPATFRGSPKCNNSDYSFNLKQFDPSPAG
jgi:hypothetical protein